MERDERERAVEAMRRAARWMSDAARAMHAARAAAETGDIDRAAALARAAAVAIDAARCDGVYARVALGRSRDDG
jgi:hypothetical protein